VELTLSRTRLDGERVRSWVASHLYVLTTLLGLLLYVPLRSIHYDLNGISDARAVESASVRVFSPNHLLYDPLGLVLYHAAQQLGYDGRAIFVLQLLTAVCGAFGLGLAFIAFKRMTEDSVAAFAATIWLGTSWAYWSFSTDVAYIVPSAMIVLAALAVLVGHHLSSRRLIAVSGVTSLAILTWQANALLIPILILLVLAATHDRPIRSRARAVGILCGVTLALTGVVYLIVGVLVYSVRAPSELMRWALNYGGAHLPMWGRMGIDRIVPLATTAVASVIPLWSGLGLRTIARGSIDPSKVPTQLSVLALLLLVGWSVITTARDRTTGRYRSFGLPWLLSAYALFGLFAFWWDPYEPKWFVVPNVFLAAVLAIACAEGRGRHWGLPILVACLVVIAAGNFSAQIWPRHSQPNPGMQTAECIASHTGGNDLVLAADWTWDGYTQYFYSRHTLNLISLFGATSKGDGLRALAEYAELTQQRQGSVYVVDLDSYDSGYLTWFASQTSLVPRDLDQFASTPAFACGEVHFRKLTRR
jgi:hypothetical protein